VGLRQRQGQRWKKSSSRRAEADSVGQGLHHRMEHIAVVVWSKKHGSYCNMQTPSCTKRSLAKCDCCLQRTLDITRRFTENRDGTFDVYEPPRSAASVLHDQCTGKQPIRPAELKTFLKIGQWLPCLRQLSLIYTFSVAVVFIRPVCGFLLASQIFLGSLKWIA